MVIDDGLCWATSNRCALERACHISVSYARPSDSQKSSVNADDQRRRSTYVECKSWLLIYLFILSRLRSVLRIALR